MAIEGLGVLTLVRLPIEVIQAIGGIDRLPLVCCVHILWAGCLPGLIFGYQVVLLQTRAESEIRNLKFPGIA